MSGLRRLLVVSHTHWDREWYHSAEQFRLRLVELVDELLDDPPPLDAPFLLDGQGVVLEDYLDVRPERAAELSALLRTGCVEAGPWYVLPDELIPSGEALVRNLLAGRAAVRRLRGEPPPVLYCPDSFGHPATLPDLARGFGCGLIVLWRGFGGARAPAGDLARWASGSGASVLLYHLPPDGYEYGGSLPHEAEAARDRWTQIVNVLGPRAATGTALLLNGADHHARQRGLSGALRELASAAGDVAVEQTGLAAASALLTAAAEGISLPTVAGELRDSYGYTWTLQGTLGSRAAQKRANAEAERLLQRDVEPWIALAGSRASSGLRASLSATWRELLRCHPHDTLCGTSTDDVARAFDARMTAVTLAGSALRRTALDALTGHPVEQVRAAPDAWNPVLELRNRVARRRGGIVELSLAAPVAAVGVGPGSATRQGARMPSPDWNASEMELQRLSESESVELTESPRAYPRADRVARRSALAWSAPMAGLSVRRLASGDAVGSGAHVPAPVRVDERSLDNGLLRVTLDEHGRVAVRDLRNGRVLPDVLRLERMRDAGDLYTPAVREALPPPAFRGSAAVLHGPLRGAVQICFAADRAEMPLRAELLIRLDAGASWFAVEITGDNGTPDQRLRIVVATGLQSRDVLADAAFHLVTREPLELSAQDSAVEHVVRTAPLHRFVSRFDGDVGTTLHSDGLAEYEALGDGAFAVTLIRSTGELSRVDLPERPGHAGWPVAVPGAQCLGPFAASIALHLHGGNTLDQRTEIERASDDFLLPLVGETRYASLGETGEWGGLELDGPFALSAVMPAERAGWTVLRCVNRSSVTAAGAWRASAPLAEAVRARLDETPVAPLANSDGVIEFTAEPFEIVTILVR